MSKKKINPVVPKPDFSKAKIISAPVSKIEEVETMVDSILEAIGHSDAYVTDESMMSDFFEYGLDKREHHKELERIREVLGVNVSLGDYLYEIALRMRETRKDPSGGGSCRK
jgi:hypothetical protein